ncbi:MAG: M18 family aminopeptidase [Clostridia bacterium]|nr:M18 family aminopeptidase [Clostridia bacterium]
MALSQACRKNTEALLQFIQKSPTAFHAVEQICSRLDAYGFVRLEETDAWELTPGGTYYLTRNQSSVIAFRLPTKQPKQALITASHTDSPMFKLKHEYNSPAFGKYLRLNTEVYGGTILSSWLDRPLSLAGRAIVKDGSRYSSQTVMIDRDLLLIPNVAIHLNRSVNSGYSFNPAVDMLPLFSMSEGSRSLRTLLAEALNCREDDIVNTDLYVYNRMPGSVWGADGEFFSAPRIDNLMCAYGTLSGFCEAESQADSLQIYFSADNEETGSATKQGAGSVFLSDVFDRICEAMSVDRRRLLASSYMASADNGHARHPNHPELSDAQNAPYLNGGVVIKNNAAQKYTTEAVSASIFETVCREAGVPIQQYANRSDQPGGSTLGSISNTLVPLCTVDIGMAQLAMHSAYETAGTADIEYLIRAIKKLYETDITFERDGFFRIAFSKEEEKH